MNFYEELKNMTDEEIKRHLSYEIYNLENRSKMNNENDTFLGYDVSYNPTDYGLLEKKDREELYFRFSCFYGGYVPKGIKVVYGLSPDRRGVISNDGMYYIIDDDSYIYEFCKYVKDIYVGSEGDLFECILWFLKKYFGVFKGRSRDEMFQMILKNDKVFFDPVNEHKLSDFKNKGNAMCSEYAIMANNILSVFGFDSYVVMGHQRDDKGMGGHAFNFVSYTNSEYKRIDLLIDFSNCVNIYDPKFNVIGSCPYILELDELNNDFVDDFITNERHIVAKDYGVMVVGDELIELCLKRERDYFIKTVYDEKSMSSGRQKSKNK